jgi:hypothetical protein
MVGGARRRGVLTAEDLREPQSECQRQESCHEERLEGEQVQPAAKRPDTQLRSRRCLHASRYAHVILQAPHARCLRAYSVTEHEPPDIARETIPLIRGRVCEITHWLAHVALRMVLDDVAASPTRPRQRGRSPGQ